MSGSTSQNISVAVPANNLVPGVYFTVDASQANTGTVPQRTLIIGQMLVSGSYTPNVPVLAAGLGAVQAGAGIGSQLAGMFAHYREMDTFTEVWLLPLSDDPAAVVATGAIAIGGTATAGGTLPPYVAGHLVPVAVSAGQTAATTATALAALINGTPTLPVTAAATAGSVALTAKNKGAVANDIDLRAAYLGAAGGEAIPAGLTLTFTPMAGGSQNPTALPTALANLASQPFDYIAMPYTDTASLNAVQAFLNDQSGRWSWSQEVFGGAFSAFRGTVGQRQTFAAARNDQHTAVMGLFDSPSAVWAWAAWFTAAAAISVQQDPALPIKDFVLPALAPPVASQDTISERNTMLTDGLSTFTVNAAGQVVVERCVSTYTNNPTTGAPDNSYRDVETLYTLMAVIRFFRIQLGTQYSRKKLVADGTPIAGGSNMTTAQAILGTVFGLYDTLAAQGLVQNPTQFRQQAQAQNAGGGVVKLLLPVQIANQLRVIAGSVVFTKP